MLRESRNILVLILALSWTSAAVGQTPESVSSPDRAQTDYSVSSRIDVETVRDLKNSDARSELVRLEQKHVWDIMSETQSMTAYFNYRLWYDAQNDNHQSAPTHHHIEKFSLYIDAPVGDGLISMGQREIAWGEAAFMPILDHVNVRDLNHPSGYYSPEAKVPVTMLMTETPLGPALLQAIWVPAPRTLPGPDAIGDFEVQDPAPHSAGSDAEYGARLGMPVGSMDANIYYLSHWARVPSYKFTAFSGDSDLIDEPQRSTMLGTSFSYATMNSVFKGDIATHSHHPATNVGTEIERTRLTQAILGWQWSPKAEQTYGLDLHADQWQKQLAAHSSGAFADETPKAKTMQWLVGSADLSLWDGTLNPRIIYMRGLTKNDELVQAQAEYSLNDETTLSLRYQRMRSDSHSPKLLLNREAEVTGRVSWNF